MSKVQFDYRYIAALIAIIIMIFGIVFDLSGKKQREVERLSLELNDLRNQLDKMRYLFSERDRARQELAMLEAEYEMLQQIAAQ